MVLQKDSQNTMDGPSNRRECLKVNGKKHVTFTQNQKVIDNIYWTNYEEEGSGKVDTHKTNRWQGRQRKRRWQKDRNY